MATKKTMSKVDEESMLHIVVEFHVVRIGEIVDLEIVLTQLYSLICQSDLVVLFLDLVISISIQHLYKCVCVTVHRA